MINQTLANGPKHLRGEAQPPQETPAAPDFSEAAVGSKAAPAVAVGSGLNDPSVQMNFPVNDVKAFM